MIRNTKSIRYHADCSKANTENSSNVAANWSFNNENWMKQGFLLFWSLGSGYGIIFAIESFFYEYFQIQSSLMTAIKGIIAVCVGLVIGIIHFILTVDDGSPKAHPLILALIDQQQKKKNEEMVKEVMSDSHTILPAAQAWINQTNTEMNL
eukprot:UN01145